MTNTIEAIVKNGLIVPTMPVELREGSRALVRIIDDEESEFWMSASEETLADIWDNEEDDAYAELLTQ